jgi:hypothetical protein
MLPAGIAHLNSQLPGSGDQLVGTVGKAGR